MSAADATAEVQVVMLDTGRKRDLPPALAATLPPAEDARATTLRQPQDRLNRRVAYAALCALAAARAGVAPGAIGIGRDTNGKPQLRLPAGIGPLHASLAHAGTRVAVALADHAVGIDIERVGAIDHQALLHEYFPHDPEAADHDPQTWFFHLWTAKEALLKAIGTGLHLPLHELVLHPPSPVFQAPVSWPAGSGLGQTRVATLKPGAGYAAAVAVSGVDASTRVRCTLRTWPLEQFHADLPCHRPAPWSTDGSDAGSSPRK
ncbi:MAG: 4'-phosphopantetheinyl transferase superfamily protein [Xanthomonadales bacterium]|nr:4'-phosphopantetheinyl transferase superfamily protein [Xanthomonadales bacterium]